MRFWLSLAVVSIALSTASSNASAQTDPLEGALGGKDPTLSRSDLALLDALKRNHPEDTETQTRPVVGLDNTVQYVFGTDDPTAICTPFDGCDVRLEAGEVVNEASMGDPRWKVALLFEGEAPYETPHVTIYPHTVGLKATLVIPTNRRTYHIRLISRSQSDDAPTTTKISFLYPEDLHSRFAAARARQQRALAARMPTPMTQPPLTAQHESAPSSTISTAVFSYELRGRAPWKPVRVFNDGKWTYIDFPSAVEHTELPLPLELRTEGDLFHEDELVTLPSDYDPGRRRMTVYKVFDRAFLIVGVGPNQVRVKITRLPPTR